MKIKTIRIYPSEVRLIVTTSDIVLPISARHFDMNYLKEFIEAECPFTK